METFVQATLVLATFVPSTNISPVTEPYFWEPRFFWITFFVKTPTETNLTQVWVLRKNDFAHPPPPQTQCQQYLSCLKIGSWDHLEQILNVTVTFVQAIFVLATFVHIRNISADTDPILTKF